MEVSMVFEKFSKLFAYPTEDYLKELGACQGLLTEADPESGEDFFRFAERLRGLTVEQLQELYVQTFDLNPTCALEVGWQLYGDNYDRGDYLVKMRQALKQYGVRETTELPDHLCHVLSLLTKMDRDSAINLTAQNVYPAVEKMVASFQEKDNPYGDLLRALIRLLQPQQAKGLCEVKYDLNPA